MPAPLIVEENVEAFLDEHELGTGPVTATRIGDGGGSNFTFLIERGGERFVLRRPPRPPLPPSAHDMVREARLQQAIRAAGFTRLADVSANALFALASGRGLLALVSVLGSLYPVVTVLLALAFLDERLTRVQAAVVAVALTDVIVLSAG